MPAGPEGRGCRHTSPPAGGDRSHEDETNQERVQYRVPALVHQASPVRFAVLLPGCLHRPEPAQAQGSEVMGYDEQWDQRVAREVAEIREDMGALTARINRVMFDFRDRCSELAEQT